MLLMSTPDRYAAVGLLLNIAMENGPFIDDR
jgi:hypothetical protein